MKTVHCDIWENSVTCFADDLNDVDDCAVSFAFADHDIDTCEYLLSDETEYTFH